MNSLIISFSDLSTRDALNTEQGKSYGLAAPGFTICLTILTVVIYIIGSSIYVSLLQKYDLALILFLILIPEVVVNASFSKILYNKFQKKGNIKKFAWLDGGIKSISILIKILLYQLTNNLILSILIGSAMIFIAYAATLIKNGINHGVFIKAFKNFNNEIFKIIKYYKYLLPFSLSSLAFILSGSLDRILIANFLNPDNLAVYSLMFSIFSLGQILVNSYWLLQISRVNSTQYKQFNKSAVEAIFLGFLLFLFYFVVAEINPFNIIPQDYYESIEVLKVLAGYYLFRFPVVFLESLSIKKDGYRFFTFLRYITLAMAIILNVSLLSIFGIILAAYSFVFSEACLLALVIIFQKKVKVWV